MIIAAVRLSVLLKDPAYLDKSKRLYACQKKTLTDGNGKVFDNIHYDRSGQNIRIGRFSLTYNQGTFVGAAVLLHQQTHDAKLMTGAGAFVSALAFSPDGLTLVSCDSRGCLQVWDVASGRETNCVQTGADGLFAVAWSPHGKSVAAGGAGGVLTIWSAKNWQKPFELRAHVTDVRHVTFSPDGATLLSGDTDGVCRLWDCLAGDLRETLYGRNDPIALAFSADGRWVGSASTSRCNVWRVGRRVAWCEATPSTRFITSAVVAKDGSLVLAGHQDGTVTLTERDTLRVIRTLGKRGAAASAVAIEPGGKGVIAAYADGAVRRWDIGTGAELLRLDGGPSPASVAVSATEPGRCAAARNSGSLNWRRGSGDGCRLKASRATTDSPRTALRRTQSMPEAQSHSMTPLPAVSDRPSPRSREAPRASACRPTARSHGLGVHRARLPLCGWKTGGRWAVSSGTVVS